jgi:hypothetical protein
MSRRFRCRRHIFSLRDYYFIELSPPYADAIVFAIDIISPTPYRCRFAAISRRLRHAAAAAI